MKRLFDVVIALVALALLCPVLVVAALAVKLHDGGPAFFRQTRVGRDCRAFGMFKFRSMVLNAASIGPFFTSENDPRITPTGRFLRRTSIDELPQLLNVLLGDMSLVGPRPDVPAQQTLYTPSDWQARHTVRPGLTGLAQAKYRSSATQTERLQADLSYAQDHSLWLDLKIIAWTLRRLGGTGAN